MSRTVDELLHEALIHFDAAADYGLTGDKDSRMALDAMTIAEDLPDAMAAIHRELGS